MTSLSEPLSPPRDRTMSPAAERPAAAGGRRRLFTRYLLGLGLVTAVLCGTITAVNLLVDPLWLGHGNQVSGRNFIFNERVAKVNLLLQDPSAYDCLIFGSSRVTLLDQRQIAGRRCANLAFSAGNIVEFQAYARYLAGLGLRPELVIVGIDDFNLLPGMNHPPEIPDFVQRGDPPPGLLRSYLSLTALDFSQRTLRELSPVPRYYDEAFVGRVLEDTPPYDPPEQLRAKPYEDVFEPRRIALYRELRETFPEAEFWGYVPPISAWDVTEKRYLNGNLDRYLDALAAMAAQDGLFARLYDFSAPSVVTWRRDNTFDGSHYYPRVNAVISERLQSAAAAPPADGFGLPVHTMTGEDYRLAFRSGLNRFLARIPDLPRAATAAR